MSSRTVPSAALVAANKRLHQLREQQKQCASSGIASELLVAPRMSRGLPRLSQHIDNLPSHLGWECVPVTQLVRAKQSRPAPSAKLETAFPSVISAKTSKKIPETSQSAALSFDLSQSVKVYPDIALGMLRQQHTAAGRLWLLLRVLDVEGTGVLRIANIKKIFTRSKTPQRLCGWRQLRNLLHQGDDIYWSRDKERVWLRSTGNVAVNLGVMHLNGRPVAIPVTHLLGSVGEARAYLYASFHAGRQRLDGKPTQKPIARDTLTSLSGITAESQRTYERRIGIQVECNYAVGDGSGLNQEERIWQRGTAAFEFVDHHGKQGKPGRRYIAWQLPNSYTAALDHRPKGRQKRINRTLNDLFMQGMTGNTQQSVEKRYFGEVAPAMKVVGKHCDAMSDVYWNDRQSGNGRFRVWHPLVASA